MRRPSRALVAEGAVRAELGRGLARLSYFQPRQRRESIEIDAADEFGFQLFARCGYPTMMVLTVHYPNIPFYSILFYLGPCGCWRTAAGSLDWDLEL